MKIKYIIPLIVFSIVLLVVGIFLKQALQIPLTPVSPAGRASHSISIMSRYLVKYYEKFGAFEKDIRISDVVSFFENECGHFSSNVFSQRPEKLYKHDFGVFLLLPKELKSQAPIILPKNWAHD